MVLCYGSQETTESLKWTQAHVLYATVAKTFNHTIYSLGPQANVHFLSSTSYHNQFLSRFLYTLPLSPQFLYQGSQFCTPPVSGASERFSPGPHPYAPPPSSSIPHVLSPDEVSPTYDAQGRVPSMSAAPVFPAWERHVPSS